MKKITQEEFEGIVQEKLGDEYMLMSEYDGMTHRVDIKHIVCGTVYSASPGNISGGWGKCPVCKRPRKYTQESFEEKVHSIDPNIQVISRYTTSYAKMKFLYIPDNQEFETTPQEIYKRVGYPFSRACNGATPKIGINDMWSTHPKAAACLTNPEDGYRYPFGTNTALNFTCPDCGNQMNKVPRGLFDANDDIKCPCCHDGYSYPEKLMACILKELGEEYIPQMNSSKGFDWCDKLRYDFYLPIKNAIIEIDGIQHYTQKWKDIPLNDIQERDQYKMQLALDNGIKYYIHIDCQQTRLGYIKNSILNSELSTILNFDNLDWKKCDRMASKSKMKTACHLFNDGVCVDDISQQCEVCVQTVYSYLERGAENNLLNRDLQEYKFNRRHRKEK